MKVGTVKFFNSAPGKNFGFLEVDGMEQTVFFHLNDYREVRIDAKGIVSFVSLAQSQLKTSRRPRVGDRICFLPMTMRKGIKASAWAPESEVESPQPTRFGESRGGSFASVSDNESGPIYRVLTQTGNDTPSIDFQGGALSALEEMYPRYADRTQDRLVVNYERDGYETFRLFEQFVDGTWTRCKDPRKLERDKRFHRISTMV